MKGIVILLIAIALICAAGGYVRAQIGGTMLAQQARMMVTGSGPLLTGGGNGLTLNGHGGSQ